MTRGPGRWFDFWTGCTSPLWRFDTPDYYRLYAAELRALFPEPPPARVLELGCGDGALFPFFGFPVSCYTGVDFSRSMLQAFSERHHGVRLVCAAAQDYSDDCRYELVFSNGLLQYLDRGMLRSHLLGATRMLAPGGRLVCGSIPWRARRWGYYFGSLADGAPPRGPVQLAKAARNAVRNPIGYWYSLAEFRALAREHGLTVEFYGSLVHLYRFHAVLAAP